MHQRENNTNSMEPYILYRARESKNTTVTEYRDVDTVENMF